MKYNSQSIKYWRMNWKKINKKKIKIKSTKLICQIRDSCLKVMITHRKQIKWNHETQFIINKILHVAWSNWKKNNEKINDKHKSQLN